MAVYIQLRDEFTDDLIKREIPETGVIPVRQRWVEANIVEVRPDGIHYYDAIMGDWHFIQKVQATGQDDHCWEYNEKETYDFVFIRDHLWEGCRIGYSVAGEEF
tara:strand:- start:2902 stop:3213 length:312 start_codon:yes stop_codon:yes gene_type:complete